MKKSNKINHSPRKKDKKHKKGFDIEEELLKADKKMVETIKDIEDSIKGKI